MPGRRLAPRLVVVAGIILAGIFLGQHHAEFPPAARGLTAIATAAWGGTLFGITGLVESVAGTVIAAGLVLAWYGVGRALGRLWGHSSGSPAMLAAARTCAFGAGVWSLVWFGLGLVGLYSTGVAVLVLITGVALGSSFLRREPPRRPTASGGALGTTAVVLLLLSGLTAWVGALAPPTAKDSLQYHIALPRAYAAAGGLVDVPYNIASFFPAAAEMNGLSAMLVGRALSPRVGEAAFGAALFAFLPLLLAAVYGWARRHVDTGWSLTAATLVATVPTVYEEASSGYVDLALALYLLLAFEALGRWWAAGQRVALADLALALGFALSVKVLAAFAVLLLALLLLLHTRSGDRETMAPRLAASLLALAGAALTASPWYVRTWVRTGSPLFPFFAGLWKGTAVGWDEQRSSLLLAFNAEWGGDSATLLDYVLTPIRLAFGGDRHLPTQYEGVLGVAFLVGAALSLYGLWRRRLGVEMSIAAIVGVALFAWWALSAQVLRYLLPSLAPLALAAVAAAAGQSFRLGRSLGWGLLVLAAAAQCVSLAWFFGDNPLGVVLGGENRDTYLQRRLDYYPYYQVINGALPPQARVWLIDMRRDTYHLERDAFSDYLFEDYTLQQYMRQARTPAELRARVRTLGVSHVLARHDLLLDYTHSPLVEEGRPEAENRARLALLRAFLTEGGQILKVDSRFILTELSP